MMTILFWFYIIGCMCGLLTFVMITLKITGYRKRKGIKPPKKHALEKLCWLIEIILCSVMPIFNYILCLGVLLCDNKKIEKIIESKINDNEQGGDQMDKHTATEISYKNGYEQGKKDAAREIFWEIDRTCVDTFGNFNHKAFAELKKKYAPDTNAGSK